MGPGGSDITPPRLYGWVPWAVRGFVKSSLLALFPERAADIAVAADPGEYGLESYYCRLMCVIIFVVSTISEIMLCWQMLKLLWHVPNKNESWITVEEEESKEESRDEMLDSVKVKVAGMSPLWKFVNFTFVFVPKLVLVFYTLKAGIYFLMETAGIDDLIVNSVALGFLMNLDELITSALMSQETRTLLDVCEELEIETEPATTKEFTDDTLVEEYCEENNSSLHCMLKAIWNLLYYKLFNALLVCVITAYFVASYYLTKCERKNGTWVSRTMYLPTGMSYNLLNTFLPNWFPITVEETPYWTMPQT